VTSLDTLVLTCQIFFFAPAGAPAERESIAEDDEGNEVTLTINIARQRIKLKARSAWDLEEHKFSKSTRGRSFTF
jgi:hypothetical protein